jgi:L-alanine-DL-glutamate epimerase-like enolase superfamily enzyme
VKITAIETLYSRTRPNTVYVRLETDEGISGLGETFYGGAAITAHVHDEVATRLLGQDPLCRQANNARLMPYVGRRSAGVEMRAASAIDLALWDIAGKASNQSLVVMLGGPMRERVPAYNTCAGDDYVRSSQQVDSSNWGLSGDSGQYDDLRGFLERPGELAASLIDDGFAGMKVWPFDEAARRTHGQDPSVEDLRSGCAVLEEIRKFAGDRIDLLVELHGLWSLPAAERVAHACAEYAPYWFEDPIAPENAQSLARFRQRTSSWTAGSEMLTGSRAFNDFLSAGALDAVIVDIGWCGGLTEALKIGALAEAHDIPITAHDCTGPVQLSVAVAFSATRPNGLAQEMVRAFYFGWYPEFVTELPAFENGHLTPLSGPGLGTELSEQFLSDPHLVQQRSVV